MQTSKGKSERELPSQQTTTHVELKWCLVCFNRFIRSHSPAAEMADKRQQPKRNGLNLNMNVIIISRSPFFFLPVIVSLLSFAVRWLLDSITLICPVCMNAMLHETPFSFEVDHQCDIFYLTKASHEMFPP